MLVFEALAKQGADQSTLKHKLILQLIVNSLRVLILIFCVHYDNVPSSPPLRSTPYQYLVPSS